MQLPVNLHKAVLAGTSRVPFDPASGVAPALQLEAGQSLWQALAAQDLWQRAGYQPAAGLAASAAAAPEAAACPRAAEDILLLLMRGMHADLLPTWLTLAHAKGVSVPHACLVPLLEQGMGRPGLRDTLLPVLGERGRWLVAQNPEWGAKYVAGTDDAVAVERAWNTGAPAQRAAALRAMRAADAAAALTSLQAGWAQEPADLRAALLPCLETGLSLADEPFLESALDDKRKEVRGIARELLAVMAGSQLGARCAARMEALFTLQPQGEGHLPVLELVLPEACDKSMKRDGVGVENPYRMGEKQSWIFNMMQCVPPSHWAARWSVSPAGVLQVMQANEFGRVLQEGLVHAIGLSARAGSGQAADWFIAIHASKVPNARVLSARFADMAMALPASARERVLHAWLECGNGSGVPDALSLARQMAGEGGAQVSLAVSRLLLDRLQQMMREKDAPDYGMKYEFETMASLLDVGDMEYLEQGWPAPEWAHWDNWRQLVDELKEAQRFKYTLHRSFTDNKE
ncbi:hypothetical protein SAMN05518865_11595 [Duganella sp. CF458]|uniref:DUF5691 domain-containing protein n=1 Tax=Duganella sp. CF458 TaxID=1884368 RepID=UPI0008F0174E|nr:DUF5691 domain-containing protein [Duganella sp. CF458]SFG64903.1 hypothetical protein SAMN05518865_11595 [Duganella sp. CF458]